MSNFQIATPNQIESIQNAFETFDSDSDGILESNELEPALRALGFNPNPEEIEDMIEDVGNNPITIKVFIYFVYMHSRSLNVEQELIDAFRVFDKEGTNKLSENKIREILKNIKNPLKNEELNTLFSRIPKENGLINYIKFVHELLNV